MAVSLLAAGTIVPSATAAGTLPITVPLTPLFVQLAAVSVLIPPGSPSNNRVELNATIGIAATLNIPQVLFRIFRDGILIFTSQQGLQNAAEQFYCVRLITADFNVPVGGHIYTLTVERLALNDPATVAGPITLSALAFGPVPN
ncbi:exosporium protein C [Paenibacillus sp. 19GGS1-52]|uniref:exosporium protein C n=1 Tax=Paenibacillus sp. 19GGS1-52 TaxID=2758563 RepID=UPI001EFA691A|nr:exosporium protein C [Paenibacillus sp. 19GGS1-52]ULO07309.1 exosporium protein C [Paenibacillus sp. 19GGS1-52]